MHNVLYGKLTCASICSSSARIVLRNGLTIVRMAAPPSHIVVVGFAQQSGIEQMASHWDRATRQKTGRVKQDLEGPAKDIQAMIGKVVRCYVSQGGHSSSYSIHQGRIVKIGETGRTVRVLFLDGKLEGTERRINVDLIDFIDPPKDTA